MYTTLSVVIPLSRAAAALRFLVSLARSREDRLRSVAVAIEILRWEFPLGRSCYDYENLIARLSFAYGHFCLKNRASPFLTQKLGPLPLRRRPPILSTRSLTSRTPNFLQTCLYRGRENLRLQISRGHDSD